MRVSKATQVDGSPFDWVAFPDFQKKKKIKNKNESETCPETQDDF